MYLFAAVKCILKSKLTKEDLDALAVEVKAMEMLRYNPNFVGYLDFFNEKYVILRFIYICGGVV